MGKKVVEAVRLHGVGGGRGGSSQAHAFAFGAARGGRIDFWNGIWAFVLDRSGIKLELGQQTVTCRKLVDERGVSEGGGVGWGGVYVFEDAGGGGDSTLLPLAKAVRLLGVASRMTIFMLCLSRDADKLHLARDMRLNGECLPCRGLVDEIARRQRESLGLNHSSCCFRRGSSDIWRH